MPKLVDQTKLDAAEKFIKAGMTLTAACEKAGVTAGTFVRHREFKPTNPLSIKGVKAAQTLQRAYTKTKRAVAKATAPKPRLLKIEAAPPSRQAMLLIGSPDQLLEFALSLA